MSYFGDNTPHQELLESVEELQRRFALTKEELVILLVQVTGAVADPFDSSADALRLRKEVE